MDGRREGREPCCRRVLPKSVYFGPRPSATFGARFLAKSVLYINGAATSQDATSWIISGETLYPENTDDE